MSHWRCAANSTGKVDKLTKSRPFWSARGTAASQPRRIAAPAAHIALAEAQSAAKLPASPSSCTAIHSASPVKNGVRGRLETLLGPTRLFCVPARCRLTCGVHGKHRTRAQASSNGGPVSPSIPIYSRPAVAPAGPSSSQMVGHVRAVVCLPHTHI